MSPLGTQSVGCLSRLRRLDGVGPCNPVARPLPWPVTKATHGFQGRVGKSLREGDSETDCDRVWGGGIQAGDPSV